MRLPPQLGHSPRPLQDSATSRSQRQALQRKRHNPCFHDAAGQEVFEGIFHKPGHTAVLAGLGMWVRDETERVPRLRALAADGGARRAFLLAAYSGTHLR